jgi:hypothetical protein
MSKNLNTPLINAGINAANASANAAAKLTKAVNAPPAQSNNKIGFYILIGVIFICCGLGLAAFIIQQVNNGKMTNMNHRLDEQAEQNRNLAAKQNSASSIAATNMKRGDQGPPGIQGPPGPTGGVHAGAGPLLCVGQKKVATPTTGTSQYSIIYLDDRRYTPIQYWTMRNNPDGTVSVVNKFTGNCMTVNNTSDVFSDVCGTPVPLTQKFIWGPNMQLASASQQNFCVTVEDFSMNTSNSNNKYDLDNMTEKKDSNNGNVSQLKLKDCGSDQQNLNKTWWIGN